MFRGMQPSTRLGFGVIALGTINQRLVKLALISVANPINN